MQMTQGFWGGDASDAHVFGKESLPIVGENVIKISIIWRAGDANDASFLRWCYEVSIAGCGEKAPHHCVLVART